MLKNEEIHGKLDQLLELLLRPQPKGGYGIDFSDFLHAVVTECFYRLEEGRFFLLVTLEEAATLRALLHTYNQYKPKSGASPPSIALRLCPNGTLLDSSGSFVNGPLTQVDRALQCLKFFNGESSFSPMEARLLLRSLQTSSVKSRFSFWKNMSGARRRVETMDQDTDEALRHENEAEYLASSSLAHRCLVELKRRNWGLVEGYEFLSRFGSFMSP